MKSPHMSRVKLDTYVNANHARKRIEELEGAFEGNDDWEFFREQVQGKQTIFFCHPAEITDHADLSDIIRGKSIAYRREQRELLKAEQSEQSEQS